MHHYHLESKEKSLGKEHHKVAERLSDLASLSSKYNLNLLNRKLSVSQRTRKFMTMSSA
ncbi:hypothetical protein VU06_01640 [Desulfobulbus sp. F3]|nr:hypothetical protein [Desulfobulbus sp. F3]